MHGTTTSSSNASPAFVSVPYSKMNNIMKYNAIQQRINNLNDIYENLKETTYKMDDTILNMWKNWIDDNDNKFKNNLIYYTLDCHNSIMDERIKRIDNLYNLIYQLEKERDLINIEEEEKEEEEEEKEDEEIINNRIINNRMKHNKYALLKREVIKKQNNTIDDMIKYLNYYFYDHDIEIKNIDRVEDIDINFVKKILLYMTRDNSEFERYKYKIISEDVEDKRLLNHILIKKNTYLKNKSKFNICELGLSMRYLKESGFVDYETHKNIRVTILNMLFIYFDDDNENNFDINLKTGKADDLYQFEQDLFLILVNFIYKEKEKEEEDKYEQEQEQHPRLFGRTKEESKTQKETERVIIFNVYENLYNSYKKTYYDEEFISVYDSINKHLQNKINFYRLRDLKYTYNQLTDFYDDIKNVMNDKNIDYTILSLYNNILDAVAFTIFIRYLKVSFVSIDCKKLVQINGNISYLIGHIEKIINREDHIYYCINNMKGLSRNHLIKLLKQSHNNNVKILNNLKNL
jgi:hypothetical protein